VEYVIDLYSTWELKFIANTMLLEYGKRPYLLMV